MKKQRKERAATEVVLTPQAQLSFFPVLSLNLCSLPETGIYINALFMQYNVSKHCLKTTGFSSLMSYKQQQIAQSEKHAGFFVGRQLL